MKSRGQKVQIYLEDLWLHRLHEDLVLRLDRGRVQEMRLAQIDEGLDGDLAPCQAILLVNDRARDDAGRVDGAGCLVVRRRGLAAVCVRGSGGSLSLRKHV